MEYEKIAKGFRKKPLNDFSSAQQVNFTENDIVKILPHRKPFLFIDSINAIDLKDRSIMGKRKILPDDPVFKGHFPDYPLYPGVLQIETIGQLGICLYYFLKEERADIAPTAQVVNNLRAIKINHALFQHEVLPGDELTIMIKQLYSDDYICRGIGQLIRNSQICAVLIVELYQL
jgi:3-hydroxymyristoyl/3-hydroxydecanoyl-(acyl carrier protein) dehydratase